MLLFCRQAAELLYLAVPVPDIVWKVRQTTNLKVLRKRLPLIVQCLPNVTKVNFANTERDEITVQILEVADVQEELSLESIQNQGI